MTGATCEQPARLEGGSDGSPQERQNPVSKFPGWTKRIRVGSAPPDSLPEQSRYPGEIYKGIRREPDRNVIQPALGTSFDFLSEAYDVENLYSWENDFGISTVKAG